MSSQFVASWSLLLLVSLLCPNHEPRPEYSDPQLGQFNPLVTSWYVLIVDIFIVMAM